MMKKILAVLLCASMVLTVSGCDNKEDLSGFSDTDSSGTGKNKGKRPGDNTDSEIVYNADGGINWDSVPYADEEDFEYFEYGDSFKGYTARITKYNGNEKVIKIPETIKGATVIGMYGSNIFQQCSDIYVKIPKFVRNIGDGCFYFCENLTLDFSEPDADQLYFFIEKNSFYYCKNLKLNMSNAGNIHISEKAFDHCTFDGSLTLPDSLKSIDKNCFNDTSKDYCPSSIVYRGETYALENFDKLIEAVEAANYVDPRPFDDGELGHSSLKINDIGFGGISYCVLQGVPRNTRGTYTVPDNVREIADYAFTGCKDMISVFLPGGVRIAEKAFEGYDGNVIYRGKTYKASEFNIAEANKEPYDIPLTDWDSIDYAPASDFEYKKLGIYWDTFISITKYKGNSKQVKIPETINGIKVKSLWGEESYDGVFNGIRDIEVLLPKDVSLENVFISCGDSKLYLPDTGISVSSVEKAIENGGFAIYKGVAYDYEHMQDLKDAINGIVRTESQEKDDTGSETSSSESQETVSGS